jgi:hypothetical protein
MHAFMHAHTGSVHVHSAYCGCTLSEIVINARYLFKYRIKGFRRPADTISGCSLFNKPFLEELLPIFVFFMHMMQLLRSC